MSDETKPRDSTERSVNFTSRGAIVFSTFLVLYVLSPGPFGWCLAKFGALDAARPIFIVVYAPLRFLYEHFDFVERFYDWQFNLFGL